MELEFGMGYRNCLPWWMSCFLLLRIASITLAHDATLLTRNSVDFAQVPGLRFENWLD